MTPERESILIDSGWPGLSDRDPKRIVHVLKDLAGCDHLDHLVTTHWHMDHFGGVEGLSRLIRIDHFWDRGLPEDGDAGAGFPRRPEARRPAGHRLPRGQPGQAQGPQAGRLPAAQERRRLVLASGGRVIDPAQRSAAAIKSRNPLCSPRRRTSRSTASDNARSLAILFTLGHFQFFDAGDLTWNVEKKLVCPVDLIGKVNLYQVTHHGMDISNHPTLVRTIAPDRGDHEQRTAQGRRTGDGQAAPVDPVDRGGLSAPSQRGDGPGGQHRSGADRQQGRGRWDDHPRVRRAGWDRASRSRSGRMGRSGRFTSR